MKRVHLPTALRWASRLTGLMFSVCLWSAAPACGGVYYSGEKVAELPSQWRGFLLDQRQLRSVAIKSPESPLRTNYLAEAAKLAAKSSPSADELADLGALYLRLGETEKAVTLLRSAQRSFPNHFRLAANLGTAWQLEGDLEQAASCLEEAVRLAPGKNLQAETYHLKLVRGRLGQRLGLDDLFGIRFVTDDGDYEPGRLAATEKKKLPTKAVAVTQQLALWLPADGRLLWQLAELANAHGDIANAAAMMDGCVTQFGLGDPELRRHRQVLRAAADKLPKIALALHETKHTGSLAFRSKRPLLSQQVEMPLAPISATSVNVVPWELFGETTRDKRFRPTFPKYLQELAGHHVTLNGFMQPLRPDGDMSAFLFIEYPVGCWYCEMPEATGIIHVELAPGSKTTFQRGLVRVTGRLTLNQGDPEDFLFGIRDARVAGVD
jgi:hypothetical protein